MRSIFNFLVLNNFQTLELGLICLWQTFLEMEWTFADLWLKLSYHGPDESYPKPVSSLLFQAVFRQQLDHVVSVGLLGLVSKTRPRVLFCFVRNGLQRGAGQQEAEGGLEAEFHSNLEESGQAHGHGCVRWKGNNVFWFHFPLRVGLCCYRWF